jgi:hypothetical protein
MGFGMRAFGKRFRFYSIGTILVLLVSGAFLRVDAARIDANLPTPWLGVTERINVYGYLLWMAVLSIALLRRRDSIAAREVHGESPRGTVGIGSVG